MRRTIKLDDPAARVQLGMLVRDTRMLTGWSQAHLAARAGTSQSQVARLELGRDPPPDIEVLARVLAALSLRAEISAWSLGIDDRREQRTAVHGIAGGYVARWLQRYGWIVATEIAIGDPPIGWIDLLAFREVDGAAIVSEIKGDLPGIGGLRRQVEFYARNANAAMRSLGWRPGRIVPVVLAVDTAKVHAALRDEATLLASAFPGHPDSLSAWLRDPAASPARPTIALVDPASRRERWLLRTPLSGRRSAAAYEDYADAARRLTTRRRPRGPPGRRRRSWRSPLR